MPHSYLFVVLLRQLELCPPGFQGAWGPGPSLHSLLAACRLGGNAWLDPQCGEWAAHDHVQLRTCVPPPPPPRLPSVCEINVAFVWVTAALWSSFATSHRGRVNRPVGLNFRPASCQLSNSETLSLLRTEQAPGRGGRAAGLRTLPLNIFLKGRREPGDVGSGDGRGEVGVFRAPCPQGSCQLSPSWPHPLSWLPSGIHTSAQWGLEHSHLLPPSPATSKPPVTSLTPCS